MRRIGVVRIASPVSAWLALLLFTAWRDSLWGQVSASGPEVPLVYFSSEVPIHTTSSVFGFILVLTAGLIAAALVEPAKLRVGGRRLLLLGTYQGLLLLDGIRANTSDWWTYLLIIVGVQDFHRTTKPLPLEWPPWPIYSFVACLGVVWFTVWFRDRDAKAHV